MFRGSGIPKYEVRGALRFRFEERILGPYLPPTSNLQPLADLYPNADIKTLNNLMLRL